MSQEEFFKNSITQVSAGGKVHRGEGKIFKERKGPSLSKPKIKENHKSGKEEVAGIKRKDKKDQAKSSIDVLI